MAVEVAARVDLLQARARRPFRVRVGPADFDCAHPDAVQRNLRQLGIGIVEPLAELCEPLRRNVGRRLERPRKLGARRGVRSGEAYRQSLEDAGDGHRHPMVTRRQPDLHLDGLSAEILPVVGERRRAFLIVRGCLHLLLVHPERHGDRLRRFRPEAAEDDLDHVLAVDRNAVHGMEGVRQAEPGDVVRRGNRPRFDDLTSFRAQPGQRGLHRRRSEERHPRDAVRGRHVLLHQHRREREDVGDVVEAVSGIVLREVVCGAHVDGQQLLDCVVVFGAVEAARGHPAGVRRGRGIDTLQLAGQPRRHGLALLFGRLLFFERRHLAAPELAHDLVPLITMFDERRARLERLEVEVVLLLLLAVAGEAVLGEEGFDDGVESGAGGRRPRRPRRWRC